MTVNEIMESLPEEMQSLPVEEAEHQNAPEQETSLSPALMALIYQAVANAMEAEKRLRQQQEEKDALSEEEKKALQLQEKEVALANREKALQEREMRAYAHEQLMLRSLPEALLPALCCKDEASCKESLDQVEKAFRTAVQEGVMERMRGEEPLRSDAAPLDTMDDAAYYHATYMK